MFQPVGSKVSFPQLEEGVLKLWREKDIFRRSVEARRDGGRFVFYEGPPTANGSPGIHHVLARVFKDIIPRYRTMKGRYAPRIAGWDTHGLPVELEVEKELGFSGKEEIEKYGVDRFNARCRKSVGRYLEQWREMTERIGFWVDLDNAYITMDNGYIETVWWAIKQMWDRDMVYQGYRVTPHCPRCGTSLSSHEVAQGYKDDAEDPSVYIKFKIDPDSLGGTPLASFRQDFAARPAYLLAWTTTPWTLPGNTALAVSPDAEYVLMEGDDGYLILADALSESLGLEESKVAERLKGSDLVGVSYQPLFNPHEFGVERRQFGGASLEPQASEDELRYKVIGGDFVTMDEGTGIVHVAPAYGEVDYEAGQKGGLDFVHPVDLQGNITGKYPFAGKFVKDADKDIIADLASRGLLYRSEKIEHTYPFCWRCEAPLLYYAKQTWYIRTTAVKERLISGNEEISWHPEHIKHGRFGDWLQNNVDWAFSRERYWGTPLPVWRCQSCGGCDCVGGVEELKSKPGFSGLREPLDLHRPFVDEVTYHCPQCGGSMKRESEVIDCWFDSGAMPIAQHHYPYDNESLLEDGRFPADYICEAVDQTRGWFYSLHAIATLLFDRPSYKNVICLGHILDAKGEKMSKARGNVVEPKEVIEGHGADALRWYFLTASPPGNVRRFDKAIVAEIGRRFLSTLWNVYSFFVTYANIDRFVPEPDKVSSAGSELDRWILSELNQLVADVDGALESYNPLDGGRKIEGFVDGLSNWYVRRSRRRFWKSESDADKQAAYNTLYHCLVTLTQLMAPFTPFIAEAMYQNLVRSPFPDAPDSVHMTDFPRPDESMIDRQLSDDIRAVIEICSLGRATRSEAGIKVRQPLAKLVVRVKSEADKKAVRRLESQVLEEVNVKGVEFGDNIPASQPDKYLVELDTDITPELKAEGMAREIVRRIQTMRRSAGFDIADRIVTYYRGEGEVAEVMTSFTDYIKQETLSAELVDGDPPPDAFADSYKLGGFEVSLGVKREACG